MIAPLLATIAPLLAASPIIAPPCHFCPPVAELHAPKSTPSFNIVFLSAGFATDAELELCRCSVDLLVDGLLSSSPWGPHGCGIGIYRIDARADSSGIDAYTGCSSCTPSAATLTPGEVCAASGGTAGKGTMLWPDLYCGSASTDIDVRHCYVSECRLVWPTTLAKMKSLFLANACTPSPSAIVIVANSDLAGGGADLQTYGPNPEFAVVTIDNILESGAWRRLGHEMAHVLGLLDEYEVGEKDPFIATGSPAYQCGRNLYLSLIHI